MTRVTFLHPDLGIGGAERLVIDAALALKKNGHEVSFVTNHHDPENCFSETRDGTIPVTVVGNWLPRHLCGKFFALFAYIRIMYAAGYIILSKQRPEVVFCDLISVCIPILRLRIPYIIYYCHYPDKLLTQPSGYGKQLYRIPLNYMEEISIGMAHKIFVNSCFTKSVFQNAFKRLDIEPEVLYPSIDTDALDKIPTVPLNKVLNVCIYPNSIILLSINRYERKKNLNLAIKTLAKLKTRLPRPTWRKIYLVMMGGYDKRVEENVEHYLELIELADELHVTDKIIFLRSATDVTKVSLLRSCTILLYTPSNEHFGIVPLEAMYAGKPVIAHNSGGPMESITSGYNGFLVESSPVEFASKISILLSCNPSYMEHIGKCGKETCLRKFSFNAFSMQLNRAVENLINDKKTK